MGPGRPPIRNAPPRVHPQVHLAKKKTLRLPRRFLVPLFGCPGPSRLVPLVGFLWLVSLAGQVGGSPLAGLNFHCIFYMLRNSNNKSKQSGGGRGVAWVWRVAWWLARGPGALEGMRWKGVMRCMRLVARCALVRVEGLGVALVAPSALPRNWVRITRCVVPGVWRPGVGVASCCSLRAARRPKCWRGKATLHVAHCLFCVVCCLRGPPRPAQGSQVTGNLVT